MKEGVVISDNDGGSHHHGGLPSALRKVGDIAAAGEVVHPELPMVHGSSFHRSMDSHLLCCSDRVASCSYTRHFPA